MGRYKNAYIIIQFPNGNRSELKIHKDSYERKKDAEAYLEDIGCTCDSEHTKLWEKDNMIYDILEIRVNKKFKPTRI